MMKRIAILAAWMLLTGVTSAQLPPLNFQTLAGASVSLAELQKKRPLMLITWCAECPSCRRVERNIDKLAQDYRKQVNIVAVDVNAHDTPTTIGKFLESQNLKFQVVLDEPGGLVERYKVLTTTTTFLFDADGQLRYSGAFQNKDEETARQALVQLLGGSAVSPDKTLENGCTFAHRKKT